MYDPSSPVAKQGLMVSAQKVALQHKVHKNSPMVTRWRDSREKKVAIEYRESPQGYYAANKGTGVDLSSILQNPNESCATEMKGSVLRSKSEMRSEEPTLIIANVMPNPNDRGESYMMNREKVNSRNHARIQAKHRKTSATIGNQM